MPPGGPSTASRGLTAGTQGGQRGGCRPCRLKKEKGPRAGVRAPLEAGRGGNDSPQSLWMELREPHFRLCLQDPRTVSLQFVSHSAVVICYSGHRKSHTLLELRDLTKKRVRLVHAHTHTRRHRQTDTDRRTDRHTHTHQSQHTHTQQSQHCPWSPQASGQPPVVVPAPPNEDQGLGCPAHRGS